MKKYYLGLIVLAVLTLGLTVVVISKGLSGRQDKKTESAAQKIAADLNNYINDNQKVPENLDEVGAKDVPSTIRYTKKSANEYEFCATYKEAKDYGVGDITSVVSGAALSRGATESYTYPDYDSSSLYIAYTHTKGENCQTVKPYIYDNSLFDDSFNQFNQNYYDQICNDPNNSLYQYYCGAGSGGAETPVFTN